MEKQKVRLVLLGHIKNKININKIKTKSKIFMISEIIIKENLPDPEHNSIFMEKKLLDDQLKKIIPKDKDNVLTICVIDYALEDNFYIRRIYSHTAILSIKLPLLILNDTSISIENFVLRNIFEIVTLNYEISDLTNIEVNKIPHNDTRKCLFDMNGEITDIVENTEQPIICSECRNRLSTRNLPDRFVLTLEKELKKIKKKKIDVFENIIKQKPLIAILVSAFLGFLINWGFTELINKYSNNNILIETEITNEKNNIESQLDDSLVEKTTELVRYDLSYNEPESILNGFIIVNAKKTEKTAIITFTGSNGVDVDYNGTFEHEIISVEAGSRIYLKDINNDIWYLNILATTYSLELEIFSTKKITL